MTATDKKAGSRRGRRDSPWPPLFALGFLSVITMAAFTGHLPRIVPGIYLGASLITFLAYALDKSAATRNAWRTQESTLHLFALLGGWPGALAAQRLLRHKTVKTSFQRAFWLVVTINCGAIVWLASANGARTLKNILAGL